MHAAVLGSPIAHSLSPVLHRAAYAHLRLADWRYDAIECTPERLPALLASARTDADFGGYSLTMPLKLTAVPLVDELEPLARQVGAVNTVVRRPDGLFGANTDVPGMVAALIEAGLHGPLVPASAVVLGGGGSSQAAIAALAAVGVHQVGVALRSPGRAGALHDVADSAGVKLTVLGWTPSAVCDAELVVSAVPAEAADDFAASWPATTTLFDLVYAPWPTALATAAQAAGARVIGGLDLLIHQAVGQVALMTGRTVPVDVLRAAGEQALGRR